jgi:hypothetical protein
MKHLFLPYELALIAKEKGFDEDCIAMYFKTSKKLSIDSKNLLSNKICSGITAPLYQQIIDWLLEKHQISIEPQINPDLRWIIDFVPNILLTHEGSGNFTFFTGSKKLNNDYQGFNTKYEALNKAIEEAFKLI